MDEDLKSIEEVRQLCRRAIVAQEEFSSFSQEEIDRIVSACAKAGEQSALKLAEMAVAETGFGVVKDKETKNLVASRMVYEFIKDMPTRGIISRDEARKVVNIASPMGLVAAVIPTTNPTSTAIYKILISVKAGCAIIVSPHPQALKCTREATKIVREAAIGAGAPEDLISCMSYPMMEGTQELMRCPEVAVILATGGTELVRAANVAGKPAYGVGPGNVPAYIERSADIPLAVKKILESKCFDNGTVCSCEQAIVVEREIEPEVRRELLANNAYFMNSSEIGTVGDVLVMPSGGINPRLVGQPAAYIAETAGFTVPQETSLLMAELEGVGSDYPLSCEKLSPVMAYYVVGDWQEACRRCIEILEFGGLGHTMVLHSRNDRLIMEFAMKKPVYRILVNTPASQGAIGATTGLEPALTLGCGTMGGSITADNITPLHLIHIKRLAYDKDGAPLPTQEVFTRPLEEAVKEQAVAEPGREDEVRVMAKTLDRSVVEMVVREVLGEKGLL